MLNLRYWDSRSNNSALEGFSESYTTGNVPFLNSEEYKTISFSHAFEKY
jgi:hypothetical protein